MRISIFIAFFFITNLFENYWRERFVAAQGAERFRWGVYWHLIQFAMTAGTMFYVLYFDYGRSDWFILLAIVAAAWWWLFDGCLNLLRKMPFMRQSTTTSDPFNRYATIGNKIALTITLLVIYLLSRYAY